MRPREETLQKILSVSVTNTSLARPIDTDIPALSNMSLFTLFQAMSKPKKLAFGVTGFVLLLGSLFYLSLGDNNGKDRRLAGTQEPSPLTDQAREGSLLPSSVSSGNPSAPTPPDQTLTAPPPGTSSSQSEIDADTSLFTTPENDGLDEEDGLAPGDDEDTLLSLNSDIDENSF